MKQSGINTTFAAAGGVVALVAMIAFLAPERHVSAAYSNPVTEVTANTSPALQTMSTSVLIKAANAGTDSSITVPTGKRLVIEYISAQATTDEGQRLQDILVETTTQGVGGKSGIPTVGVYPVQNGTLNGKPNWVRFLNPSWLMPTPEPLRFRPTLPGEARPSYPLPFPATT